MSMKPDDKIGLVIVILFLALLSFGVAFSLVVGLSGKFEQRQRDRIIMEKSNDSRR